MVSKCVGKSLDIVNTLEWNREMHEPWKLSCTQLSDLKSAVVEISNSKNVIFYTFSSNQENQQVATSNFLKVARTQTIETQRIKRQRNER